MNWGKKILTVYIVFVLGIVFMVYKSTSQTNDLVTTDYYAKELKYQDKIEEIKRVNALAEPVTCDTENHALIIRFPKTFAGKQLTGEAVLYCPSDEKKDLKTAFRLTDESLQMQLPAGDRGLYELHLSWKEGEITYYFEKKIII